MDPVFSWTIAIFIAGLLITAGGHKLSSPYYYQGLIRKYIPVNASISVLLQYGLGVMEIGAGFLLLHPGSRSLAALVALSLFLIYLCVIAGSLARGIDMDCGCSGPLGKQKVSPWLLVRNGILAVLTSLLVLPVDVDSRVTGIADMLLVASTTLVVLMIYLSCETLLSNQQKLRQLRGS